MINGLCHSGNWGSLGSLGGWGWAGFILSLVFLAGLIASLALLVFWAVRRARASTAKAPDAAGHPTAKEILQAQYARGEIAREQYELRKQELGKP